MTSVGTVLDRTKGIGQGFDTLRVALSILILVWHSVVASYGREYEQQLWADPLAAPLRSLLPVFFALSGFLVMGSAVRTPSLRTFLTLRALRIVPALATEITLSALILGPLLTTLPLKDYFTDHRLFAYFGSLFGRVRMLLPGVFELSPFPDAVNLSLWTIPPELLCYVYLAMLLFIGVTRTTGAITAIVAVLMAVNLAMDIGGQGMDPSRPLLVRELVLCFALGNLAYIWRHRLPYSAGLFAACVAGSLAIVALDGPKSISSALLTYCIVFLGTARLPRIKLLSSGDYSYGIYLYAFPVQQAVASLLPGTREFYWNILISLPITVALAMLSWHIVEKPALSLRTRLAGQKSTSPVLPPRLAAAFATLAMLVAFGAFLSQQAGLAPEGLSLARHAWQVVTGIVVVAGAGVVLMQVLARRRNQAGFTGPVRSSAS